MKCTSFLVVAIVTEEEAKNSGRGLRNSVSPMMIFYGV